MILSVIIPLYNNARFLRQCVESLYKQGIDDSCFEVIIVDDGSTDGGEILADKIALEYDNIKVLHQKNAGPGAARNTGMAIARGEYIHFVDADDFLLNGSYKYIFENFLKYDADILQFSYGNNECFGECANETSVTYVGDAQKYIRNNCVTVLVWAKLIKKSFIDQNALSWDCVSYSEDTLFTWKMLAHKATLLVCDTKIYSYRMNENSLVHSRKIEQVKKSVESLVVVNQKLEELSRSFVDCPPVKSNFTHKYWVLFNRILCVPYTYREIKNIFAKCSKIGIDHLCPSRPIKLYDFLYRHPRLYFVFQPVIRFLYFRTHGVFAETEDFIAKRLKK